VDTLVDIINPWKDKLVATLPNPVWSPLLSLEILANTRSRLKGGNFKEEDKL
jgi:hypothetical protein